MGRRDPVLIVWVLGLALAGLAYAVGPQNFLFRVDDWLHVMAWRLGENLADLSIMARDLVRAFAIGLYGIFVVLGLLVVRRGGKAAGALIVLTIVFLFLVGGTDMSSDNNLRWFAALILSLAGALSMTRRLRQVALVPRGY